MKRIIIAVTGACLLAALTSFAQEEKKERPRPQAGQFAGRPLGMMGGLGITEKLNLTDEQKKKAAEISRNYMPQIMELQKKMREEFRSILNDEQKKTFDEAAEQMRQRFQHGAGKTEGKGGRRPNAGGEGEKK